MSGELTTGERRYQTLLAKIKDSCTSIEKQNLKRYHKIGKLFAEFVEGLDSSRYGDATVEKLATDLTENGVLTEVKDPRRFLYWAKNVYDGYPDFAALEELAVRGFTVSHAKRLFALSSEVREEVENDMIQDGEIVSTRVLDDMIQTITSRHIADASGEAAREARERRESSEAGEEADEETSEDEEAVDGEGGTTDDTPDDADGGTGDGTSAAAPATGAPIRERSVPSPLKTLKNIDKALVRANMGIPDAFIVLRETAQIGFDSEQAENRYRDNLRALKATAESIIEPLQELITNIQNEL